MASSASTRINEGATRLTARYSASGSSPATPFPNTLRDPRGEHAAERPSAADHVLPQPALGLVDRERLAVAERRALQRLRDPRLVQTVAALVHRPVQPRREEALVPARRDPHVVMPKPVANGWTASSIRQAAAVEAHQLEQPRRPAAAGARSGSRRSRQRVVDPVVVPLDDGDQRHQLRLSSSNSRATSLVRPSGS